MITKEINLKIAIKTHLNNEIVSKIREAERSYLSKRVQESVGDIKKHWDILKKIINKMKICRIKGC